MFFFPILQTAITPMPKAKITDITLTPQFSDYKVEKLILTAIYPQSPPEKMPVLLILTGFDGNAQWYLEYIKIEKIFEQIWYENPFIAVIVSPTTELYSCCYINSELSGKWEDIVYEYLPTKIDEWVRENLSIETGNYCLLGHSLGGFGALYIGARHPDVFQCIGSISGILTVESIYDWTPYIKREGVWNDMDQWNSDHFFTRLSYQLCANFLSQENPALFKNEEGNLYIDENLIELMKKRGFDILSAVKDSSITFSGQKVFFAAGKNDIVCSVKYHQDMQNFFLSNENSFVRFETFEGDHINILGKSIQDCLLFFFQGED